MDRETGQFEEFVGRWGGEILKLWDSLAQEERDDLTKVLGQLPLEPKGWKSLIDSSLDHIQFAAGDKRSIAIVGPANAGKSTLYNQLIQTKDDRAKVSAVPGTTRDPQESDVGLFLIVDTPGADAAGSVGIVEKEKALDVAAEADVIVAMFDAAHGIREPEEALFQDEQDGPDRQGEAGSVGESSGRPGNWGRADHSPECEEGGRVGRNSPGDCEERTQDRRGIGQGSSSLPLGFGTNSDWSCGFYSSSDSNHSASIY